MKFSLKDFLELDTKELFAVNGGYYCTGSSGGSSPSGSKNPGSTKNSGGGHQTFLGRDSTSVKTHIKNPDGSCTVVTVSKTTGKVISSYTYGVTKGSGGGSSGGGSCGGYSSGSSGGTKSSGGGHSSGYATTTGGSSGNHGGGSSGSSGGSNIPPKETDITNPVEESPSISNPVEKPEITGGIFAQITDGSYADELTMQYYKNGNFVHGDNLMYGKTLEKDKNGEWTERENKFSTDGCLETATAKIISELTGIDIYLATINQKVDENQDGLLSRQEIEKGINHFLDNKFGDIYDVKSNEWKAQLTKEKLAELTSTEDAHTTYVLGRADLGNYGTHWVLIEGWSTNEKGQVVFDYDGTSDNDVGRTYVLGNPLSEQTNTYGINKIETFTVYKK